MSNTDTYQEVTDKIIAALDGGTIPWRKPWTTDGMLQQSVHGRPYRGINQILCAMESWSCGYTDSRWITFKQTNKLGGKIKKGERGTVVILWKRIKVKDAASGEDKVIPLLRAYKVWNVEQTTLELDKLEAKLREHTPVEEAEAIWQGYEGHPDLRIGGPAAYYSPADDSIGMPPPERFDTAEDYYSALFHEAAHSTGAAKRLDREEVAKSTIRFGSEDYSREELVAEIAAAMLRSIAGIETTPTLENSAAYIDNWRKNLSDDPKLIVQAAAKAQKASDYILGLRWDAEAEKMVAPKHEVAA